MKSLSNVALRWFLCSATVIAAAVAPQLAKAEEPTLAAVESDPTILPPVGTSSRLLWTGAALSIGWYGAAFGSSYLWQNTPAHTKWRIPVVGPWMALGDVGCSIEESNCNTPIVVIRTALTLISSVGQVGGLLAFTEGLLVSSSRAATGAGSTARRSSGAGVADASHSTFEWMPLPLANPNGFGLEILGRF